MTCNEHVYVDGKFAFRTDANGVDFIREQLKLVRGTASGMVVRDEYHRDGFFPLGATGEWLRCSCKASGRNLFEEVA